MDNEENINTGSALPEDSAPLTEPKSSKKQIKRLKIAVTQKEIDESVQAKSNKCMIQESIKRMFPKFINVWVDKNQVRFTDPNSNLIYTWELSPFAKVMLLKWDDGETISPFDVWLKNPIVRERKLDKKGFMRAKSSEQSAKTHRGAIPQPLTKEARRLRGRDRVYGQKLWTAELEKLRQVLLPT